MKRLDEADQKSLDIVDANVRALRKMFPDACTPDGVDLRALGELIGALGPEAEERYGLSWLGKRRARQVGLTPTTGTLLPRKDDSVSWETTKNLFIEGDNLEVLKLLLEGYSNKIKAIYIDPPYNTGKEFVYSDSFQDPLRTYLQFSGQLDDKGLCATSESDKNGRFHSRWLSMMYPRLHLARRLLRRDGVIFLSIDDNEHHNLRSVCDEIFGEENFISELIWHLPSGPQAGHFTRSHETVLVYAKDKPEVPYFPNRSGGTITHGALKKISTSNPPSDVRFKKGSIRILNGPNKEFPREIGGAEKQVVTEGTLRFENGVLAENVTIRAGWAMRNQLESWLSGQETRDSQGQRIIRFFFNAKGILFYEKERDTCHPKTVLRPEEVGDTRSGGKEIEELFGVNLMSFPKPSKLIRFLLSKVTDSQDIVLDFFAGSATTADAVIQMNSEDGGARRFIMVQLPEKCPESSDAFRNGCTTIAEIGRERIRRVIQRTKDEAGHHPTDWGFKAFRLAESNIKPWHPHTNDIKKSLLDHVDHLVPGRTDEDLLYEIMLKRGVELTAPIIEKKILGHRVFAVKDGPLIACLSDALRSEEIEGIADGIIGLWKELSISQDPHVMFKDSAYASDNDKVNMAAILGQRGIGHVRSL